MLQKQQEYIEQQKQLEERQAAEKEAQELEKLDHIKNKKKEEESKSNFTALERKLVPFPFFSCLTFFLNICFFLMTVQYCHAIGAIGVSLRAIAISETIHSLLLGNVI